jgi:type VI secretion system protein ImpD
VSVPRDADEAPLDLLIAQAVQNGAGARALASFHEAEGTSNALRIWFGEERAARLLPVADRLRGALDRDIAALDRLIGEQVDAILQHPDLQALEGSWRGLNLLISAAQDDERVEIRLLSATWAELERDFRRASEFDQSALFDKIYNEEFGMPGGLPYGLIVCGYEVRHRSGGSPASDDISTLTSLSAVAAAAFAPCVVGAGPELFGIDAFSEMSNVQDVQQPFRTPEYARWRRLQAQPDTRFLAVCLPRILLRGGYRDTSSRMDGFRFRQGQRGGARELWGNAAFAFGANVVRAFRNYGWFADIRGARLDQEDGGLVVNLPAAPFSTREALAFRRPVEVELTDRKQKQFEEIGLLSLSPCQFTPHTTFLGTPSLHVPPAGATAIEAVNERISSMLQYVLCVSRFAHYVKVMARDYVGAFTTATDIQQRLNTWLRQYVAVNTDASDETKARFPLHGAHVGVTELAGKPGSFACVMQFQPHFQIDQMVASFRLYTELHGLRIS